MKRILFSLLFLLAFCRLSFAGVISVDAWLSPDDVTISHLETMRSTFQGAINSADGGLLQTATVTSAKLDANTNPENRWDDSFNDYVYNGLLPPTSTDLISTTTAGTAYIYGVRVVKDATSKTYTASKHTYVDLSKTGTYTYSEVEINSSAPSVASSSIRLALVSTDTSKVLSVTDKRVTSISTLSVKVGSFTRDISVVGDQVITGVGFTPKSVDFITQLDTSASIGFDNTIETTYQISIGGTTPVYGTGNQSIYTSIDGSNYAIASISATSSDGFTITWSKTGSPTGTATMRFKANR